MGWMQVGSGELGGIMLRCIQSSEICRRDDELTQKIETIPSGIQWLQKASGIVLLLLS